MNNRLDLIRTTLSFTLLQSLKKMDEIRRKLLLVVDKEKYIGLLSIGDVQRAILLVKVYFWEDLFGEKKPEPTSHFNVPVVIMAVGFGSRFKSLTNVIPKLLIPIGEKTISIN